MEYVQRELAGILLAGLQARGLITQTRYSGAMDLLHTTAELPALFRDPACLTGEAGGHECASDTP